MKKVVRITRESEQATNALRLRMAEEMARRTDLPRNGGLYPDQREGLQFHTAMSVEWVFNNYLDLCRATGETPVIDDILEITYETFTEMLLKTESDEGRAALARLDEEDEG